MGFRRLSNGATIQGNRSPSLHKCQCLESWNPEKDQKEEKPHTSIRMLRTQNSYSVSLTQEISSVFTEQFQTGLRPNEREPTSEKFTKENSVNKEMLKSMNSQEVNSLVCARRTPTASGNRWRESLQNFESRSTNQLANACELASFWRAVETGVRYIAILDVDDGFEDFTPVRREYTHSRADPQS